jgi:hypothetical protein
MLFDWPRLIASNPKRNFQSDANCAKRQEELLLLNWFLPAKAE